MKKRTSSTSLLIVILAMGLAACGGGGSGEGVVPVTALVSQEPVGSPQNPPPAQNDPGVPDDPTTQPTVDLRALSEADLYDAVGMERPDTNRPVVFMHRCMKLDEIECQNSDNWIYYGGGSAVSSTNALPFETALIFTGVFDRLEPGRDYLPVLISIASGIRQLAEVGDVMKVQPDGSLRANIYKRFDSNLGEEIRNQSIQGFTIALIGIDPNSVNSDLVKVGESLPEIVGGSLLPWTQYESEYITVAPRSAAGSTVRTFIVSICGIQDQQAPEVYYYQFDTGINAFIQEQTTINRTDGQEGCYSYIMYNVSDKGGQAVMAQDQNGYVYWESF